MNTFPVLPEQTALAPEMVQVGGGIKVRTIVSVAIGHQALPVTFMVKVTVPAAISAGLGV